MDIPEIFWEILLRLPYREIFRLRCLSSWILNLSRNRLFWEEKSAYDFGSSLRFVDQDKDPEEGYRFLMAEKKIPERGIEAYLPITECLELAFERDNYSLIRYFFSFSPSDQDFFLFLTEKNQMVDFPIYPHSQLIIQITAYYLGKRGTSRGLAFLLQNYVTYLDIILIAVQEGAEKANNLEILHQIKSYRFPNIFNFYQLNTYPQYLSS